MQKKSLRYWMPGLTQLMAYERDWIKPDLRAGLSVAAVALPIAIAYAELTGVAPQSGCTPVFCR